MESAIESIRSTVGGSRVVCGLSGGVDSAVAAALHSAIGEQLTCVFVDTQHVEVKEADDVVETFSNGLATLIHVDAQENS